MITLISCATVAAVWLLSTYFGASASGVTAEAANRKLWSSLKLPDSASDVTYAVDSGGCEAEFAISESDFVNWCASNNWEIEKIAAPTIYFEPIILGLDEKTARISKRVVVIIRQMVRVNLTPPACEPIFGFRHFRRSWY